MAEMVKDWQALDARIAREVLNCVKWDELTDEEQDAVREWRVWRYDGYDGYWWQRGEGTPRLMCGILLWQPHLKVAQALMALDAVAEKYQDVGYTLERATPKRLRGYMCAVGNPDAPETLAFGPTLREAICVAIEKFMDAQKEER